MSIEEQNFDEPQKPQLTIGAVSHSFLVQWTEDVKSEVSEDYINRMSIDEFSLFVKCKLPEKHLTTMRDTLLFIGDDKRMILLNHIKLCRRLGRL